MKRRRAKQIATNLTHTADFSEIFTLTALCDDGTIWRRIEGKHYRQGWEMIEDIPQISIYESNSTKDPEE